MKILAINPGSTSTKIGLFEGTTELFEKTLRHSAEELAPFGAVVANQKEFRKEAILAALEEAGVKASELNAIACRGGVLKPIAGGTYKVDDAVIADLLEAQIQHPASLAGIIGKEIADENGIEAFFTDAPVTYELSELASFSGHKAIKRKGRFHALNQKAIARKFAENQGKKYEDVNVIVCHMGGGITVGAHMGGQTVDVNDAVSEGPFTPERSGDLPTRELIDICFSGEYTHAEMKAFIQGKGGAFSYTGSIDMREIEEKAEAGDAEFKLVTDAMAYQVSKQIAAMGAVFGGEKVDGILLTGGIAYSKYITAEITKRVEFIAPVTKFPGEVELEALVLGTLRVVNGEEAAQTYA
ncbi:butyrate kinase [Vibrio hangzhouensis]|uniref:butyrate kinase n=1 Tax=Vibrio hangzhouensis TaxID=462991 RepID=UPI001C95F291|nr:butyrate kinase [Vibrio hangzhouensis]MBY6197961.1 butyrate kinase [Vibrio hangzhouensis]